MAIIEFKGAPIEKLIETVSQGIGTLYKPRAIRKEADAEAYRIEKLEEANAKAALIKDNVDTEIIERARQRFVYQEVNRQINLDHVVEKSTQYLNDVVSETPVDEDWRTKFFNKAQDITSEEMQDIWARILANEVSKPGTISLRTLDIISNLSKKEAEIFQSLASLSCYGGSILKIKNNDDLSKFGISFGDILLLKAAGLVHDNSTLNITYPKFNDEIGGIFRFGEKIISVKKENYDKYTFSQISLTPAGEELMEIIKIEYNYSYLEKFIAFETSKGFNFSYLNQKLQVIT